MHIHYHLFIVWLHQHAQWGGVAAFVIAFAESVAIIGSIVPGSVTMTAVGVLIGSGVLPIWTTFVWAISGAFIGDGLSYLLGFRFKDEIRRCWPFSRYPRILSTGEVFFFKHGGKSVFIGRFVGPVRAIVPIIAGMLKMSPKRYFPISFITAICWAPVYMLPGIALGAVSLTMPADIAAELIVFILLLLVVVWLAFWTIKILYQKTHNYFEIILDRKWQQWLQQPSKRWLCNLLRRADRPYSHGQLLLAGFMLLTWVLFLLIAVDAAFYGPSANWVKIIYSLFRGLRTDTLDRIAIVIISFGYHVILATVVAVLICWLALRKRWLAVTHWLFAWALVIMSIILFKSLYVSFRPPGLLNPLATVSFPSRTVTGAIVFYILFAFMFTRNMHKEVRKYIYGIALTVCIAIALARLYLGLNWLTDVIGGICLGSAIVSLVIISYRRYKPVKISVFGVLFVTLITFVISDGWYLYKNFNAHLHNFQRYWPVYTISQDVWWNQSTPIIPVYRNDRFGRPAQLFNLQWAGSLDEIKTTLKMHGWKDFHISGYTDVIIRLLEQTNFAKHRPSLLAKLYNFRPPVLEMINENVAGPYPLVIRLWKTDIILMPTRKPLWVGVIGYHVVSKHFMFFHKEKMIPATDQPKALQFLTHYVWCTRLIKPERLPKKLHKQHMLVKVLLIGKCL